MTFASLVVLPLLHSLESDPASNHLMAKMAFVLAIDLITLALGFV